MSNRDEVECGADPTKTDTDNDGVPDNKDAVPNDPDFTFPRVPQAPYAFIDLGGNIPLALNADAQALVQVGGDFAVWSKGTIAMLTGDHVAATFPILFDGGWTETSYVAPEPYSGPPGYAVKGEIVSGTTHSTEKYCNASPGGGVFAVTGTGIFVYDYTGNDVLFSSTDSAAKTYNLNRWSNETACEDPPAVPEEDALYRSRKETGIKDLEIAECGGTVIHLQFHYTGSWKEPIVDPKTYLYEGGVETQLLINGYAVSKSGKTYKKYYLEADYPGEASPAQTPQAVFSISTLPNQSEAVYVGRNKSGCACAWISNGGAGIEKPLYFDGQHKIPVYSTAGMINRRGEILTGGFINYAPSHIETQAWGPLWQNNHVVRIEERLSQNILANYTNINPRAINPSGVLLAACTKISNGEVHSALLLPVDLKVDANRDGKIDNSDQTTADRPYRFWINDDQDEVCTTNPGNGNVIYSAGETAPVVTKDSDLENIHQIRDLEDYARLWIDLKQLATIVKANNGISVGLQWKQIPGSPDPTPTIKIFKAVESDGGTMYLTGTDTDMANSQITGDYDVPVENTFQSTIVGSAPFLLPQDFWDDVDENTPKHLLFEGVAEGKGQLTLVIYKGTQKIGEGGAVYMDIKNVKKMYVRAKGTPEAGIASPWTAQDPVPTDFADDKGNNIFDKPNDEEKDVIVFVHGIHSPGSSEQAGYIENISTSETIFKRLWHAGYKGRFACYTWPAMTPTPWITDLMNPFGFDFNQSEYRGWKYGRGLKRFVTSMPSDYFRHILAHSQGNAVTGAAFRSYGLSAQTWIPTNGAIPIICFDSDEKYNNTFSSYTTPDWAEQLGYRGYLEARVDARVVNFNNPMDKTTGVIWETNQWLCKPATGWSYAYGFKPSFNPSPWVDTGIIDTGLSRRFINDNHESMAMAVKSRSKAIGQGTDVVGIVESNFDINAAFGFKNSHSAQWSWEIQTTLPYYKKLISVIHE